MPGETRIIEPDDIKPKTPTVESPSIPTSALKGKLAPRFKDTIILGSKEYKRVRIDNKITPHVYVEPDYYHKYSESDPDTPTDMEIIGNELPNLAIRDGFLAALERRRLEIDSLDANGEDAQRLQRDFHFMLSGIAGCLAGDNNFTFFAEKGVYLYKALDTRRHIKTPITLNDGAIQYEFQLYNYDLVGIDSNGLAKELGGVENVPTDHIDIPGKLKVLIRPDQKPQRIMFEYVPEIQDAATHYKSEGAVVSKSGKVKPFDRVGLSLRLDLDEHMVSGISLDLGRGYHWSDKLIRNADLVGRLLGETHLDTFEASMQSEFSTLAHAIIDKLNTWFTPDQ